MNFVTKHKIAFVAVPKTACSSFKHLFFQLENRRPFKTFRANNRAYNVHTIYPSRYFEKNYRFSEFDDYFKFLIVRDPVKRLLSSYSNRVVHYKNLAKWALGPEAIKAGARPDPGLVEFVDKLDLYREHSGNIRHHTDPVSAFSGPDLSRFDAVYPIEQLDRCAAKLSEIIGQQIAIPHEQSGGPKLSLDDLPDAQLRKVVAFYRDDYALLSEYYTPPQR